VNTVTPLQSGLRALGVLPQALNLIREGAGRDFALSAAALIVTGLVPAAMGLCAKLLVDALVSGQGLTPLVLRLVAAQLLLAILALLAQASSDYWRGAMRERLQRHLRLKVAGHAARLDLAFFELPGNYDAFAKAQDDLGYRPFLMAYALIFAAQQIATVLGFFLAVLTFQPLLALALVFAAIPTLFAAGKSGSETYSTYDLTTPEGRRAAYLEDLLTRDQAAKEVRLYGLAPGFVAQLAQHTGCILREKLAVERRRNTRFALAGLVGVTVEYAALGFVVWRVATGGASLGDLTLMVAALAGVRLGLSRMLAYLGEVYENSLFFQNLTGFLAEQPSIRAPMTPQALPPSRPHTLKLEDVTFAYPGAERPVFEHLTLELRAGETTALVGVNGAGKTTLVKLLTRLYDPQAGRVALDGVDVRDFEPDAYRGRLGAVLQDFTRYQLSARENIVLGRVGLDGSEAQLRDAAEQASALALIEGLPEGWDTLLGRQFHVRGQDLSGGQWQRIALARALYRDTPVLLLDEPTAALDAETEAELFSKYRDLTRGKTTLLITHRFNTVRMADRIVVLEDGKVIEDGTHRNLLRQGGRYAEMYAVQAEAYRLPAEPGPAPA
jgi:ATP-binding cassette subfamily B protein